MSKKEFEAGDEVWLMHNNKPYKVTLKTYSEFLNSWSIHEGIDWWNVNYLFHTPEELLENIKQEIDEQI